MDVFPIYGSPALTVKTESERILVVADLHLGLESELAGKGLVLPGQISMVRKRLLELIRMQKPDRLIFLGDLKHNVPIASWQEWRELPEFLEELLELVRVEVILGNHDGGLEGMVPRGVRLHPVKGLVLGERKPVGLIHGHAWSAPELLRTELLVSAHNHPAVEFRDRLGARALEPVWLRCELDRSKLPKKLRHALGEGLPEMLVMPAFSELVGRAAVNRTIPEELLGPMFKAGAVKLEQARVYLLDGTFLGTAADLEKF